MGTNTKLKYDKARIGKRFVPNYTALYTVVFLAVTAMVFHYFLVWGKVSVWYDDGKVQNYNALVYIGVWFRDILKNIFINHTFIIPTYSFTLGYGGDIVQFLHFYVLGDPFNLLSVFVPSGKTIILYHVLIVLRLYFAGFAFSRMCLYFNKNIDRYALLAGALSYAFGAFALVSAVRHPYFINPMIYMPIIIIGLEKIRQKETPVVFVLGVFLSAVSNFYFLFQIALFSVLYLIGRMIFYRKKYNAKENIFYLLKLAAYALLGAAMAGAVFIPVFLQAVNDPRLGVSQYIPLVYEKTLYENYLKNLIASDGIPVRWTCIGMGGALIPALYTLFAKKGRTFLKVIVIAIAAFSVIPIFGHIFNDLSYISNRWIWVFALALAYVIAVTAEDFAQLSKKDLLRCFAVLIAYLAVCFVLRNSFTSALLTQILIAAAVMVAVITLGVSGKLKRFAGITVAIAVIAGIGFNAYFTYSPMQSDFLSEYCEARNFNKSFNANEADLINKKYDEPEFFRYSGTSLRYNASLLNGTPSTQFYYSLSNPNMFEFFSELNSNVTIGQLYKDLNDSTYLNTLANVKYFVLGTGEGKNVGGFLKKPQLDSEKRVPYGYDMKNAETWAYTPNGLKSKKSTVFKGSNTLGAFSVYENKNFLPFGYTYSGYISRGEYNKLSPLEKQEALLQGVVLDKDADGLKSVKPKISSEKINYKVKTSSGLTKVGKKFIATEDKTKITLILDGGKENSETYIHFKNIGFTGTKVTDLYNDDKSIDPKDEYTQHDWESNSPAQQGKLKKQADTYQEITKVVFKLSSDGVKKDFNYRTPHDIYYQGRQDFLINMDYSETPKKKITVTLPYRGVYSFDSIDVYSLPMDGYESRVEKLGEDSLQNVNFHDGNNSASTNEITGNISLKENKLLCLTIPYSTDWKAYVDGKEVEILRANTAFSGIMLSKGNHKIRLAYSTQGFGFGIALSIAGVIGFIALIAVRIIRKKSARKTQKN